MSTETAPLTLGATVTVADVGRLPDRSALRSLDDGGVLEYRHGAFYAAGEEEDMPASLVLPARLLDVLREARCRHCGSVRLVDKGHGPGGMLTCADCLADQPRQGVGA